jgi:NAD(P)-dependent dehydrogenase (short-subunit alcohol dehydrogenase family)
MSRDLAVDLSESTALITGASTGIGEDIAHHFAESGADIIGVARSEDALKETIDAVEDEHGVDGLAVPADLREETEIEALLEATIDEFGVPDILVNNAGVYPSGPALEMETEDIDDMLDINNRAMILLSMKWGKAFRESDLESGRIINISSVFNNATSPRLLVYGSTKFHVRGITMGFAAELARDGVTVNTVSPGFINSHDWTDEEIADFEWLGDRDRIPVGRVGDTQDVANACLYLASDASEYMTGADILIDGGVAFTAGVYPGTGY